MRKKWRKKTTKKQNKKKKQKKKTKIKKNKKKNSIAVMYSDRIVEYNVKTDWKDKGDNSRFKTIFLLIRKKLNMQATFALILLIV